MKDLNRIFEGEPSPKNKMEEIKDMFTFNDKIEKPPQEIKAELPVQVKSKPNALQMYLNQKIDI